jgi:lantibiotic modifying enzyme
MDRPMTMTKSDNSFLEVADGIGARLCRDALWAGNRCNWLGAAMEPVGGIWRAVQRTFGPEPYSGTSGIALFLGQLHGLVPERIYRMTALGAIRQALSRLEAIPPPARAGFYTGWTGLAYICTVLGPLLDEPALVQRGVQLLEGLAGLDPDEQGLDVLAGLAGAIPALLDVAHRQGAQSLLDLADIYGQRLLATARRSQIGWSWNTLGIPEAEREQDLLGFSHGTAGIAWALLELYRETGQVDYREAAEGALGYERHWFSREEQNWPDFRGLYDPVGNDTQEPGYMMAWCHGAPGIGLSRLRAYEILGVDLYRQEAETAVQATRFGLEQAISANRGNYSLCHGLGGNADLLLYASTVLDDDSLVAVAEQVGRHGAERFHATRMPWPCGVRGAGETPGLFLGTAGIGYFYLRLHNPDRVRPITIVLPN